MIKAREIRDMEDAELRRQAATKRRDLLGLRLANATGELDDTAGLGRARRELARMLTVARERDLAAERAPRPRAPETITRPTQNG